MPNTIQSQVSPVNNRLGWGIKGWWHGWDRAQFATFNRWNGKPNVNVNRNDNDWNDNYVFGGVRNSLHFSPPQACLLAGEFCLP